jgi:hypothetical protein
MSNILTFFTILKVMLIDRGDYWSSANREDLEIWPERLE